MAANNNFDEIDIAPNSCDESLDEIESDNNLLANPMDSIINLSSTVLESDNSSSDADAENYEYDNDSDMSDRDGDSVNNFMLHSDSDNSDDGNAADDPQDKHLQEL